MQINGKITNLLPLQTGQGKNGEWKKQEFIIETAGQYPKKVCVTAWGKTVDYVPNIGTEVNIQYDLESNEHNGRWYNSVKAFKIETVGKSAPKQNNDEQQYQAHVQERASAEFEETDGLPF